MHPGRVLAVPQRQLHSPRPQPVVRLRQSQRFDVSSIEASRGPLRQPQDPNGDDEASDETE